MYLSVDPSSHHEEGEASARLRQRAAVSPPPAAAHRLLPPQAPTLSSAPPPLSPHRHPCALSEHVTDHCSSPPYTPFTAASSSSSSGSSPSPSPPLPPLFAPSGEAGSPLMLSPTAAGFPAPLFSSPSLQSSSSAAPSGGRLLLCLAFIAICLCLFLAEYVYLDHLRHASEAALLQSATAALATAESRIGVLRLELDAAVGQTREREQAESLLHSQLSQRDAALVMYRQLVEDLQERSAATEAEQALSLQRAQAQARHILNQTSALFHSQPKAATVEAVTRVVEGGGEDENGRRGLAAGGSGGGSDAVATRLVDAANNEYILSSPRDSSLKTVDGRLILDLGVVFTSAAIGGLLASLLQQPPLLGYLLAGSAIGPGGLRLIGQFVQVETLAEFGATFLLFALGVEFSMGKLMRVRTLAVGSGSLSMLLTVGVCGAVGWSLLGCGLGKSLFIGAVLSMSSTTVVVKSLMERRELDSRLGQVMLGLLIVQDLFLSLLLSGLSLASSAAEDLMTDVALLLLKFVLLGGIVVCCAFLWPLALRMLDHTRSHDLLLLGLVALCVIMSTVADRVIGSAEVGAFLAGILVSSSPTASTELTSRSLRLFEPIRDLFAALFLSSMGMLISPHTLLHNWQSVVLLVLLTLLLKTAVTTLSVRLWSLPAGAALHVGLCLSQIGEFAFVLASRGLRASIIAREDYMLLLAVTAVTIFVTPAIMGGSFWLRRATGGHRAADGSRLASRGEEDAEAAEHRLVLSRRAREQRDRERDERGRKRAKMSDEFDSESCLGLQALLAASSASHPSKAAEHADDDAAALGWRLSAVDRNDRRRQRQAGSGLQRSASTDAMQRDDPVPAASPPLPYNEPQHSHAAAAISSHYHHRLKLSEQQDELKG